MVPNFTVRKTLANVNGGDAARTTSHQRKTLMHSKIGESDRAEEAKAGLQNSVFNLEDIERKLAKLAQVHLILEHMLFIRTNLDMDTCNAMQMRRLGNLFNCSLLFNYSSIYAIIIPIRHERASRTIRCC